MEAKSTPFSADHGQSVPAWEKPRVGGVSTVRQFCWVCLGLDTGLFQTGGLEVLERLLTRDDVASGCSHVQGHFLEKTHLCEGSEPLWSPSWELP